MIPQARFEVFVMRCIALGLTRHQAAVLLGVNYNTFKARVLALSVVWPYESGGPHKRVCANVAALAALFGVPRRRVSARVRTGMSLFDACTKP